MNPLPMANSTKTSHAKARSYLHALLFLSWLGFQSCALAQTESVLYSFGASPGDGSEPEANLTLAADGNFYGTTYQGGADNVGTVFKVTSQGAETPLYSFPFTLGGSSYEHSTEALVQGTDGNFYGTTQGEGGNPGALFMTTPGGSTTFLYTFNGVDGFQPNSALIEDGNGNFYGITARGGSGPSGQDGTVFEFNPTSQPGGTFTILHNFNNGMVANDGFLPFAGLINIDGSFYGTTEFGGSGATIPGTVYKLTQAGGSWTETILYSFGTVTNDGLNPKAPLVRGQDGNLYGTTSFGGTSNDGTVFKLTPNGSGGWNETVLHSFTGGDGSGPVAGLVQGSDGNFYGMASQGGQFSGSGGSGTIYKITPTGIFSLIHSFGGPNDGNGPFAGLVSGGDGNLYGTTEGGGQNGLGTVFKLTFPQVTNEPTMPLGALAGLALLLAIVAAYSLPKQRSSG